MENGTGCAIFHQDDFELNKKLLEPSRIFTAKMTAICLALVPFKVIPQIDS
jgi:hypothetical protein